jgi:hypothetical protein
MMSRRTAAGALEPAGSSGSQGLFRDFSGRLEAPAPTIEGEVSVVLDVVFVVASIVFFGAGAAYLGACRALERFRS